MERIETEKLFLRKTSGLRRSATSWDVFIFNTGIISIGFAITFIHFFGPAFYPGSNLWAASLLTVLGMIFVGLSFYFWSITMARSGGSYVFLSRSIHPSLGFAISWVEVLVALFYSAYAGVLIVTIGLTTSLTTIGAILNNKTLLRISGTLSTNPLAQFLIALVIILLCGVLLISGMKRLFLVQKIMFTIAILGTLLTIIILIIYDRNTFIENLSQLFPSLNYQSVIDFANNNNWSNPGFNFGETVKIMVWPMAALIAGIFSIGISGEIRRIEKSQIFGILGAVIFSGLTFSLISLLANKTFGYNFQGSIAYNFVITGENSTFTEPYLPLLLGILTNNIPLIIIISLSFIAWLYLWIPALLTYANRAMFAWSLDRLAPGKLGQVSDKHSTPIISIILSMIITSVLLFLYLFTPWLKTLSLFQALLFCWGITLLAGALFPFIRRNLYERSPASNYSFGKFPLMTIICLIGAAFLFFQFYQLWNDKFAAGHDLLTILTLVITFVSGIIFYIIVRAYRLKQGIEIDKIFKEIPIE